jgi:hypothetical protein
MGLRLMRFFGIRRMVIDSKRKIVVPAPGESNFLIADLIEDVAPVSRRLRRASLWNSTRAAS